MRPPLKEAEEVAEAEEVVVDSSLTQEETETRIDE
jgi:hypothetical protein